ncbi:MAG: hypothetical protein ABRQ26_08315 [Syntrophomonadaceae bacterium]
MRNYGLFLDLAKRSAGGDSFYYVDVLSDNYSPRLRAEQAKQLVEDGYIEIKQLNATDTSIIVKGRFTNKGLNKIRVATLRSV